jgi:hypothetical protein
MLYGRLLFVENKAVLMRSGIFIIVTKSFGRFPPPF